MSCAIRFGAHDTGDLTDFPVLGPPMSAQKLRLANVDRPLRYLYFLRKSFQLHDIADSPNWLRLALEALFCRLTGPIVGTAAMLPASARNQ